MTTVNDFTRLQEELEKTNLRKNITTVAEFEQFRPLFQQNPGISDEAVKALSSRFEGRFNLFSAIIVKDADGTVVFTIPPVYTATKRLENIPGGREAMNRFIAAKMRPPDPIHNNVDVATQRLRIASRNLVDEEVLLHNEKIWRQAVSGDTTEDAVDGDLAWE